MNRRAGLVGAAIGLAMTAGACATAHRPAAKPTPTPTLAGGSPAAGVPTAGADPARIDPANFVRTVDNPWFPLVPGQSRVYEGVRDGKAAHEVFMVTAETKTILGVPCVVVRDSLALVPSGEPPFPLPTEPFGVVSLHRFELLSSRRLLLVLDNCEHLLQAVLAAGLGEAVMAGFGAAL